MAIWHKSVISLILWFDFIYGQFVVPSMVKKGLISVHACDTCSIFNACAKASSPANMCDVDSGVLLDFCTVLVPGSSHSLVRHLTLEHRLVLRLHCEVGNALVDLQVFFCPIGEHKNSVQMMKTVEAFRV